MIAALYVVKGGCYFGLPDVDPWDKARDARLVCRPVAGRRASAMRALGPILGRSAGYVAAMVETNDA